MAGQHRLARRQQRRRRRAAHRRGRGLKHRAAVVVVALLITGCSGDDSGAPEDASSTTTSATGAGSTAVEDSPIPAPNAITVGGRAEEVFVPVEGYEYLEPPAAVLERFTAGFEAQGAAAQVVDSVAARTVVGEDEDEGAVVISIAIDDSVGPLAEGFRDGVLSSMSSQATPEEVDVAGVPATFVDTGEQQALYVQQDTTVLFFLGANGRDPLVAAATALVGGLSGG